MKLIVVPILMLLLLTQTFSKWMWVMEFNINKDFISKNLCINKEKPQLKCGGKCQLMKRLAAEEEAESRNQSAAKTQMSEVLFVQQATSFEVSPFQITIVVHHPTYNLPIYTSPTFDFFHPPAFAKAV